MLVLVFGLVLAAGAMWLDTGMRSQEQAQLDIDQAVNVLNIDLNNEAENLSSLGNWIGQQGNLVALVKSHDSEQVTRAFEPLVRSKIVDAIIVVDDKGVVLSRVRRDQPVTSGDNVLTLAGIKEGLSGRGWSGADQDSSGKLQLRFVTPIYAADQASPVGVLVLASVLDDSFVAGAGGRVEKQVVLVYGDRIVASTLTDRHGQPWTDKPVPASALSVGHEGRPSAFLTLETDNGKYLFRFSPLTTPIGSGTALFGVGISQASIDANQWLSFRPFGVALALGALLIALLGFSWARGIVAPLQHVLLATRGWVTGDLALSVPLAPNDELGELAKNLNALRQNLDQSIKRAELERSRYLTIIYPMATPMVITDDAFCITAVNRAAEVLLDGSAESLANRRLYDFLAGSATGDDISAEWNVASIGLNRDQQVVLRGRFPLLNRPQVVEVVSTRVRDDGGGYVHLLHVVTVPEQPAPALDDFLLNVAHELRAPLTSLRAAIELLLEDYASMGKRDLGAMLKSLQKATVKFEMLVENLIEIGTIPAGRFRVRPVPTAIGELVRDAVDQITPLLQSRGQVLDVRVGRLATVMVMADRPRVLQVLINLISNASKYGPEDAPIVLTAREDAGFAFIGVTDRGPGIPKEEQSSIFERFYRIKQAEKEGVGIGLGLGLAREIVEAHGGQLNLGSEQDGGTTFWFSLPQSKMQNPQKQVEMLGSNEAA